MVQMVDAYGVSRFSRRRSGLNAASISARARSPGPSETPHRVPRRCDVGAGNPAGDKVADALERLDEAQGELDQLLSKTADNWSLSRMASTDRNVLRLGAFEILYTETPDRAAINEAVEVAKSFGGTDGYKWVNGVLNKLGPQLRPAEASQGR